MAFDCLIPKKFLFCYKLSTGATVYGILMTCLMIICSIATIIQVLSMDNCSSCERYPWRNAYSFSVTSILYCLIMLAINVWFLWGVKKEKSSVVISWVVITLTWLIQSLCLMIVMLCMYSRESTFISWLFSSIFTIIFFGLLLYGCLIGYGYWLELKHKRNITEPEIAQ